MLHVAIYSRDPHKCATTHLLHYALRLGCANFRQGEALKPGPGGYKLEVANITHTKYYSLILRRTFDALFINEHNTPPQEHKQFKANLGKNYKCHLSKLDKEHAHNSGGTGIVLMGRQ